MTPILIFLFFIIIIIGFTLLLGKLHLSRFGYWLLGGYAVFLIAGVIAYYFIPTENGLAENDLVNQNYEDVYLYHQIVEEGVPLVELEQYKKKEWNFDLAERDSISLYNSDYNYYFPVIIKRVEDQETIQVTLYEVEPSIELEMVEDYSDEVRVDYTPGTLTISPPGHRLYRFSQVAKGFPFNQFDEDENKNWFFNDATSDFRYETVFYVTIPADIELNASPDLDVHWLN